MNLTTLIIAFVIITIITISLVVGAYYLNQVKNNKNPTASAISTALIVLVIAAILSFLLWIGLIYYMFSAHENHGTVHHQTVEHHVMPPVHPTEHQVHVVEHPVKMMGQPHPPVSGQVVSSVYQPIHQQNVTPSVHVVEHPVKMEGQHHSPPVTGHVVSSVYQPVHQQNVTPSGQLYSPPDKYPIARHPVTVYNK